MRRARMFFVLGVWTAVLPYLGFPYFWKNILLTLSGLSVAYVGYAMYREFKSKEEGKPAFDNFSENHGFVEDKNTGAKVGDGLH